MKEDYEKIATKTMINALEGVKAQIRKAYDKGYKDGTKEKLANAMIYDHEEAEKKAYDKGLSDAWDLVKRIESTPEDGGLTNKQIVEVFGQYWSSFELYRAFSVEEAMDLMKAYEDKQKQDAEIKVGDEVKSDFGNRGVVITNEPDLNGVISVLFETCSHVQLYPKDKLTRTGRTFSQIAEVLKELRGAENDK